MLACCKIARLLTANPGGRQYQKAMLHATNSGSQIAITRPAMLSNIPDLMITMAELNDDSVQRVRKTAEIPPRVSVYDTIAAITGYPDDQSRGVYKRLLETYPEVGASCTYFKFPGRGQRDTPGSERGCRRATASVGVCFVFSRREQKTCPGILPQTVGTFVEML